MRANRPLCRDAPFRGGRLPRSRRDGTKRKALRCRRGALRWCRAAPGPATPATASGRSCRWPLPSSTAAPCAASKRPRCTVEVHLANGLPSFTLVGLADTEVKEARERVRAALQTSGLEFPHNKRVTVSLAPADLPKESGRFDLPIALGILAAAGQIDAGAARRLRVRRRAVARRRAAAGARRAGDGARRCSAAPAAIARARWCCRAPAPTRRRSVGGLAVRGADHLLDVVRALLPGDAADARGAARRRAARRVAAAALARPARRARARPPPSARSRSPRPASQPADGRPARHRQVDAGAAPRRPAAAADARRGARVGGDPERRRRLRRRALGPAACCARRITPPRRRRWSAAARRRARARSRSRTTACSSSTSCRSSRAPRSRRCASRSRPAASSSRARRGRPSSRPASSSSRR